jgi:hypothetical protein
MINPRNTGPITSSEQKRTDLNNLSPTGGEDRNSAEFGRTVSEPVAEILRRVPVLDERTNRHSELLREINSAERMQDSPDVSPNSKQRKGPQMQTASSVRQIRTADTVRETINQDGAVLLDIKQGLCFSMNPVGSKIWEMLKKENSLEEIAKALEIEFRVPRSQIEADITDFVAELRKRKLIEEDAVFDTKSRIRGFPSSSG